MSISVIGGGITGLVAAYLLSSQGKKINLYESAHFLGGQASTVKLGGFRIERGYHHLFKNDHSIQNLLSDLGLNKSLSWNKSSVGTFTQGKLFPFSSPSDLLKFYPLSLSNRIKLGLISIFLQNKKRWQDYENISANEWIKQYAGLEIYETVWKPLLEMKFGEFYEQVGMPWFWSKMKTRFASRDRFGNEILGYLDNSFEEMITTLRDQIEKMGGKIHLNSKVIKINQANGSVTSIIVENLNKKNKIKTDLIISTAPSYELLKMVSFDKNYTAKLKAAQYLGASVFILLLKNKLSPYYWINVTDKEIPFLGLIEHTNLVDKKLYEDNHIVYITNYASYKDSIFKEKEEVLLNRYLLHMKKINPNFKPEWVKDYVYNAVSAAQPIMPINYSEKIPSIVSPIKNLYIGNTTQIYPEDRGTNYSVKIAGEIVSLITEKGEHNEK